MIALDCSFESFFSPLTPVFCVTGGLTGVVGVRPCVHEKPFLYTEGYKSKTDTMVFRSLGSHCVHVLLYYCPAAA